jgi:hypothetical protein
MMMPAAMAATVVATGAATPTGAPVATTPVVTPTSASTATPPAKATAGNPTNTAAPVEAEAEPPPLDHTAIKKLRDQWKQVQAQVKSTLGYKVWAALNSVRDIAVSDRGVAFAFGTNAFAQQMISEQENHSRIVTILSDFLGRPVQLECQLGEQAKVARRISTNETLDANGADPLVEYAVNNLGAKVVDEAEQ